MSLAGVSLAGMSLASTNLAGMSLAGTVPFANGRRRWAPRMADEAVLMADRDRIVRHVLIVFGAHADRVWAAMIVLDHHEA